MTLSGTVWPVHFPPQAGESLTSWFTRLSLAHLQYPSTFFKHTVPANLDTWKQDLDVVCPERIIPALSQRCGQTPETIKSLTLHSLREHFDPYLGQSTALPRWVSPAYIRRKTAHHRGLRVCADCLRGNVHYKLFWRFMFSFACPHHSSVMVEECPRCHAFIASHKVFAPIKEQLPMDALAFCHHCGYDFRALETEIASEQEIKFVAFCYQAVRVGTCEWGNLQFDSSHSFFQGLRLIAKGLLRQRMFSYLQRELNRNLYIDPLSIKKHDELEFFPIGLLRHVLMSAFSLLDDWPHRFLTACETHDAMYSDWIRPRDVVPSWFKNVLMRHLPPRGVTFR